MEMECILVSKDNQKIKCKYYELGRVCQEIIQKEMKDIHAKEKYVAFSQKYTYFTPFFDFVLQELGYKLINAFDVENAIMYAKDSEIHWVHLNQDYTLFSTSDDEHIGLEKINKDNFKFGMLDKDLYCISSSHTRHEMISRLILHNYFLGDKELFQKYMEERNINFYFFDHIQFLIKNKSFLRAEVNHKNEKNKYFAVFKNRDVNYEVQGYLENVSPKQDALLKELKEKGILLDEDIHLVETEKRSL